MRSFTGIEPSQEAKVYFYPMATSGFGGASDKLFSTVLEACDAALAAIDGGNHIDARVWLHGIGFLDRRDIVHLRNAVLAKG
ncbi:MAG: hypothetical protein EON59_07260 [Alphaproteobacteria bacterium]|nr:MAG: hypothetical protein EON59_07260 [Alphaproteobacteria bacterium]